MLIANLSLPDLADSESASVIRPEPEEDEIWADAESGDVVRPEEEQGGSPQLPVAEEEGNEVDPSKSLNSSLCSQRGLLIANPCVPAWVDPGEEIWDEEIQ